MPDNKALLLVTMEPAAGLEEEFNDWYDTEHFPQRGALPGFETAARFVCIEGWPRWLALYDLTSAAVLDSEAYRAVSGANNTPWSRRILPRTLGRLRIVAEQIAPGNALLLRPGRVSRLAFARWPTLAPGREQERSAGIQHAAAQIGGVLQSRIFRSGAGSSTDLWLIAELGRPQSMGDLASALAQAGGAGPDLLNICVPYWRT